MTEKIGTRAGPATSGREIEEVSHALEAVARAVAAGAAPAQVCDLLYAEDALIVGEGLPTALCGREACVALLTEVLNEWGKHAAVRYVWRDPILQSEKQVATLLQIEVTPAGAVAPSPTYRVLYVWRPGPQGWRVGLEMFGVGTL